MRDYQKQMIISWFHSAITLYQILDDTKLIKMEEVHSIQETVKEVMYPMDYLLTPGWSCRSVIRRTSHESLQRPHS